MEAVLSGPQRTKANAKNIFHEMMEGLHRDGAIDKQTMREFDAACLSRLCTSTGRNPRHPGEGACLPAGVRALPQHVQEPRLRLGARRQETGGPALRLLALVSRNGLAAIV